MIGRKQGNSARVGGLGAVGLGAAGLAALWGLLAAPAAAQETTTGALLTFEETRRCICWETEAGALQVEVDGITQSTDALQGEFDRVDLLLRQAHETLDASDQAEVESVARISARREALRQQLENERRPMSKLSIRLGEIARQYNAGCAGRRMLKMNVDAVRENPQCPPQP